MGTAYTPGLKVSPKTIIKKTRRLPLKGNVTVDVGEVVHPDTVVARTDIPGIMQTVKVAEILGVEPNEVEKLLKVKVGDLVKKEEVLAENRSFFGLFKSECKSPLDGTVELFSEITGHVGIRQKPLPVEVTAYMEGKVAEVIPEEGVVVETEGAFIQGIFGVGGERTGSIKMLVDSPDKLLTDDMITPDHAGMVLIGGSNVSGAALKKAADIGAAAVVVGAIIDKDLIDFLGYDIGVAITGQENINTTLVVTEGFGAITMASRTFELLRSLEGERASVNGATQIRAGVIRPEVVVPVVMTSGSDIESENGQMLEIGALVRIIREPYFGLLGEVVDLPSEPVEIPTGATTRVLAARLADGRTVTVPRANVEIIEG